MQNLLPCDAMAVNSLRYPLMHSSSICHLVSLLHCKPIDFWYFYSCLWIRRGKVLLLIDLFSFSGREYFASLIIPYSFYRIRREPNSAEAGVLCDSGINLYFREANSNRIAHFCGTCRRSISHSRWMLSLCSSRHVPSRSQWNVMLPSVKSPLWEVPMIVIIKIPSVKLLYLAIIRNVYLIFDIPISVCGTSKVLSCCLMYRDDSWTGQWAFVSTQPVQSGWGMAGLELSGESKRHGLPLKNKLSLAFWEPFLNLRKMPGQRVFSFSR